MKRIAALVLSIILCLTLLCACGRKTDENGNTLITSSWKCVSYTVNGTHTEMSEIPFVIRIFMSKDDPKFKCDDGMNFTFTLLQKERTGRVSLNDDGTYSLINEYGNSIFAKIEGNNLILYDGDGKMEIVFETS